LAIKRYLAHTVSKNVPEVLVSAEPPKRAEHADAFGSKRAALPDHRGKSLIALPRKVRQPDVAPSLTCRRHGDQTFGHGRFCTRKYIKAATAPLVHANLGVGKGLTRKCSLQDRRDRVHSGTHMGCLLMIGMQVA